MPGYVAFDVETVTKDASSVCAVGLAVIDGRRVVERGSYLIRPPTLDFWGAATLTSHWRHLPVSFQLPS
jgi:hypothetical protein